MDPTVILGTVAGCLGIVAGLSGLRVIREGERGVVLRLGRRGPVLAPGLRWILPLGIDRLRRVDLRSAAVPLMLPEVITSDGVPLQLTAVMHMQVVNPLLAVTRAVDHRASMTQLALASLHDAVATRDLRSVLTDPASVRASVDRMIRERSEPWGVTVTAVDVLGADLPEAMRRAMAEGVESRARASVYPGADEEDRLRQDLASALREVTRLIAPSPESKDELPSRWADLTGRPAPQGRPAMKPSDAGGQPQPGLAPAPVEVAAAAEEQKDHQDDEDQREQDGSPV